MKRSRFTESQIVAILKEADAGVKVTDVCRRIVRRRHVRRDEPHRPPVIAELPSMLERSKAGPGLLAAILTANFCDHLPLYRQEQIARWRHGNDLTRQDMSRWVGLAAERLRPILLGLGLIEIEALVSALSG